MKQPWIGFSSLYRRELAGFLATPVAYVFVAAFLAASVLFAFQIGQLFESGRADLGPFFQFHPWLYLIFMPALSMRAWADESRGGTIETLLSLPVPTVSLVLGKFFAAWTIAAAALVLSFPLWISIAWLGPVDHGATLAAYFGSLLAAGAYLAIGTALSAACNTQVVAFVLAVLVAFGLTAAGLPIVSETLRGLIGSELSQWASLLSLLDPYDRVQRGVITAPALVYFLTFIAAWLLIATVLVDGKRVVR